MEYNRILSFLTLVTYFIIGILPWYSQRSNKMRQRFLLASFAMGIDATLAHLQWQSTLSIAILYGLVCGWLLMVSIEYAGQSVRTSIFYLVAAFITVLSLQYPSISIPAIVCYIVSGSVYAIYLMSQNLGKGNRARRTHSIMLLVVGGGNIVLYTVGWLTRTMTVGNFSTFSLPIFLIIKFGFSNRQYSSRNIMEDLFDYTSDLAFLVDQHGTIRKVSKRGETLLGYPAKALLGQSWQQVSDDERIVALFQLPQPQIKIQDSMLLNAAGKPIAFDISMIPIQQSMNELLGYLLICTELSTLHALKAEIDKRIAMAQQLQQSEKFLRMMLETLPFGMFLTKSRDDIILFTNEKALLLFDATNDLMNRSAFDLYADGTVRTDIKHQVLSGQSVLEQEVVFKKSNGELFTGTISMQLAKYQGEEVLLSCITDISEKRLMQDAIEKSELLLRNVLRSIPDMVFMADMQFHLTYTNESAFPQLGYRKEEFPNSLLDLFALEDQSIIQTQLSHLEDGYQTYRFRKKDGSLLVGEVNATILYDHSVPEGFILVARDISERMVLEEERKENALMIERMNQELRHTNLVLKERSVRDSLTGLYNHQHINHLIARAIEQADKDQTPLCCMMLDIDYFKRVNDTYGHQFGDLVLKKIASLIKEVVRKRDLVGRYGGEEFVVVLPDITMPEAYRIAERIRKKTTQLEFAMDCRVSISIGLVERDKDDAKTLINLADTLLYMAKENGRNRVERANAEEMVPS